ncbi:MAG TPA: FGGY family carbohydrate kinase [Steroidobacteraceae bacterium]|nr:FGGY family carbohydrate kinase [Steroidobacteraceae bacterium]
MTDSGPLVLGIDLGTSAVKVIAMGVDGTVADVGSAAFTTIRDLPDQAEQDPAAWVAAVAEAVADLEVTLRGLDPGWKARVAAVGVAGQLPTLVCCDARGPLGRAITWQDARADAPTLAALDPAQRRDLYRRTGMPIDGRYLGPMFRHHWLARRAEVESVLSAKDYLVSVLTGRRLTDPSTAAGYGAFDLAAGSFARDLTELWQLPAATLPAVQPAHSTAGTLTAAAARLLGVPAAIPVTVGAADSVSGAFAMAALQTGIVCITMGSSTIIIDAIREARLDPAARYLLTPHVEPGWYAREMDLLATGTGYRWLSDLLHLLPGKLDELAAEAPPGAHDLFFTPYLAGGEQGALWNPALRASISGLTLRHGASDIARAFLEGIAFEIRRCIGVLAETAPVREVVVSGHLAEHRTSLQMLADVLHRPVQPFPAVSPAALGAALGAARAIGSTARGPAGQTWPPKVLPSEHANTYERLYASYLDKTRA